VRATRPLDSPSGTGWRGLRGKIGAGSMAWAPGSAKGVTRSTARAAWAPRRRATRAPGGKQPYLRQRRSRISRVAAIPIIVGVSWGLVRTDHRLEVWRRPVGWGRRNRGRIRLGEKEMTGGSSVPVSGWRIWKMLVFLD
jgi:hypothetical protein